MLLSGEGVTQVGMSSGEGVNEGSSEAIGSESRNSNSHEFGEQIREL